MDRFTSAQEQGCEVSQLTARENAIYDGTDLKYQHLIPSLAMCVQTPYWYRSGKASSTDFEARPRASDSATNITKMIPSPSNPSAVTATFNTTELLEQILSYSPAPQILTSKATCRSFRNAIEASPMLRRKTTTFLRLGDIDEENDLFSTDAGGEFVFAIRDLEPLAFFYPGDGERRLFVRFEVGDAERFLRRIGKADGGAGFQELRVVDQRLGDVRVGWHCGCFEEGRGEVRMVCEGERVTFGDVFGAMEGEHRGRGKGRCGSLRKFWMDGLWKRSGEMREFG